MGINLKVSYYYYCKDHQGNNREVWRANDKKVVQRTQYYPFDNNNFNNRYKTVYYDNGVDGYIATPDGSLKKYDVETTQVKTISLEMPSDPEDPERKNKIKPTDAPVQKSTAKSKTNTSQENNKKLPNE